MEAGRHGQSDRAETGRRLTVQEAADELGISAEAVRSRLKRGTLRSVKDGPTVYVLLETDQARPVEDRTTPERDRTSDQTRLVESLEDQVAYLREQLAAERDANRENRRLLAAALERIPELEPASEPRDASESASRDPGGEEPRSTTEAAQEGAQSPWWRRIFGG